MLVVTDFERGLRLLNMMTCGFSHTTVGAAGLIFLLDDWSPTVEAARWSYLAETEFDAKMT